ncbi:MAG: hypothetical protein IH986_03395 [Planctomycetes bacterium]|nr:hypothetical protein [Planctomycetota bacterium]
MAPITTISFTRDGRRYNVGVDLDDRAIMDGKLALQVSAKVTDSEGHSFEEFVTLELDLEKGMGKIFRKSADDPWCVFPLPNVGDIINQDGVEAPPGMETGDPEEGDAIANFVEERIGERVCELIGLWPVPDPILGCALKAGISSALGQTLTCNKIVSSEGTAPQRVWRVVRCLRDHVGGIFTCTLWRTGRCILGLGIF